MPSSTTFATESVRRLKLSRRYKTAKLLNLQNSKNPFVSGGGVYSVFVYSIFLYLVFTTLSISDILAVTIENEREI